MMVLRKLVKIILWLLSEYFYEIRYIVIFDYIDCYNVYFALNVTYDSDKYLHCSVTF